MESMSPQNVTELESKPKGWTARVWNWYLSNNGNWLEKQRGILILATIMVAAVSFYSALHPPVQTEVDMDDFSSFLTLNTIIMVISLMILVVLLSGVPLQNKFCLWVLNLATLCIMFFVTVEYLQEIAHMSPDTWVNETTTIMCFAWMLLCLLAAFIHTIFFIIWVVRKLTRTRGMTRNNDSVRV
ncbi:ankyrin repeat-containing domain, PGG domain protein [Artemisia annua]|uniref:Ankyrin repeat-containing domain, PGG domain protein n=1 Tax=Artemisia annua TaxID=35608 RepID=A0A2U1MPG0_ARTAN|nr:ankyrin repeat-containing domain, PGG domain protein [Artemisia annua]